MPDGGSSQPPVLPQPWGHPNASTRATLPYRRPNWKGLALRLKTEFKGFAWLDFWPIPWLGGKSGFLPPQAVLAIVWAPKALT